jgi:hypothetical protein
MMRCRAARVLRQAGGFVRSVTKLLCRDISQLFRLSQEVSESVPIRQLTASLRRAGKASDGYGMLLFARRILLVFIA